MHRIMAYIELAIIFIIIISLLYIPVFIFLKKKGIKTFRQLGFIGMFISLFLIVFATILFVMTITFHPENYTLNLNPFHWISKGNRTFQFITEKIPNIMLFLPLGFFTPIVFKNKRKFYHTLFVSLAITLSVEFFQYFIGRSSDIVDVLTNLLGAAVGYGIFKLLNKLFTFKRWWNDLLGN